jgi:hypothetical protein
MTVWIASPCGFAMTETCAASPAKAQPEAIQQSTSFLFFPVYGMGSYNDVNPFCLIVSLLDCFTLRVRNDGDVRRVTSEGAA